MTMTNRPRVMAKARPGAMPLPVRQDVHAFTKPAVHDRWAADAAGIRAVAMDDSVITMFDVVGEDFWSGGGITAKKVSAALRAIGDRPVEVQINSPGGDMFEGIAIYNVLREHPQQITVKIMGMAASAASVNGIVDGAHAVAHANWLGAIDVYRGATRKVTTEWDGRLVYPGTHLLSDLWFLNGKAVVGIAARSGNVLTLDAIPDVAAGAAHVSVRTRAGREWGILNAVFDGMRTLALNDADVTAATIASGLALTEVIARETQDPTTVTLGDLTELQETYIARSAIPSDEDHVDIEMVLDDPRVWQILDETIVTPPAPVSEGPTDPLEPVIPAVHARCDRIETGIELVWSVSSARGAVGYTAELSYDAGETWETLQENLATMAGRSPMRQSDDPVTFRARAFGKTGLPGPWVSATFTTVAPAIDGAQVDLIGLTIDHLDAETQAIITGTGPGSIYAANQLADEANDLANDAVGKIASIRQALLPDPLQRNLSTDIAVRSLQDTLQGLAEVVADTQLRAQDLQGRLVEIGVEKTDGAYKISGLAVIGTRINSVSLTLDALSAKVSLLATTVVDGDFDGLIDQITAVGADLDALEGTLTLYVRSADFSPLVSRVTEVEIGLDAANAAITLKASQAVVTALGSQVSTAQAQVSAISGIVLSSNLGAAAIDDNMRDQTIEHIMARLHQLEGFTEQNYASAALAINTKVDDQGRIVASQGVTLTAVQGNNAAQFTSLTQAIAAVDSAQTTARQALAAIVNDPATGQAKTRADLITEQTTRATETSALSSIYSTLNATVAGNTSAIVAAQGAISTEQSVRASAVSVLTTNFNGISAQINNPSSGLAAAFSAVANEATARSTGDSTQATNLATVTSQINDGTTGLAATRSRLITEESTRSSADTTAANRLVTLESTVNDGSTGLPATRAAYLSSVSTQASTDSALSSRIDSNVASINGVIGFVTSANTVYLNADSALSSRIDTVSATANGISANGSLLFSAEAAPAGATAAFRLKLTAGAVATAMTVLAMSDGTSRVRFDTSNFDIVNSVTGQNMLSIDGSGYVTVNSLRVTSQFIAAGSVFKRTALTVPSVPVISAGAGTTTSPVTVTNSNTAVVTTPGPTTLHVVLNVGLYTTTNGANLQLFLALKNGAGTLIQRQQVGYVAGNGGQVQAQATSAVAFYIASAGSYFVELQYASSIPVGGGNVQIVTAWDATLAPRYDLTYYVDGLV